MNTTEQYECGNCYFVGELDVHGGCGRCHSQAVLSLEKVRELFTREIMLMDQRRAEAANFLNELRSKGLSLNDPVVIERAGYWLQRCQERDRECVGRR